MENLEAVHYLISILTMTIGLLIVLDQNYFKVYQTYMQRRRAQEQLDREREFYDFYT